MTYQEKLYKILLAIAQAREITPSTELVQLIPTKDNGLLEMPIEEIYLMLRKIEDEEDVFLIRRRPKQVKVSSVTKPISQYSDDGFALDILDGFDDWYSAYLLRRNSEIENVDFLNFIKIYDVVLDIKQKLQVAQTETVNIALIPTMVRFQVLFPVDSIATRDNYAQARWEAVNYLHKHDLLKEVKMLEGMHRWENEIKVVVDVPKFETFYHRTVSIYKKNNEEDKPSKQAKKSTGKPKKEEVITTKETAPDALYTIKYTSSREVLLNDMATLAKPHLNSENDLVMAFLYNNPNKKHTKVEIEKEIKQELGKSLHKIVENLGFTSELKKAFFEVSQDAVTFINPVTAKRFNELGLKPLKVRKAK